MGVNKGRITMVDLNIANFITVGLISVASFAAIVWAFTALGINTAWLGI
jgi:hypothetical protein